MAVIDDPADFKEMFESFFEPFEGVVSEEFIKQTYKEFKKDLVKTQATLLKKSVRILACISKNYKVGITGQTLKDRMKGYPQYEHIFSILRLDSKEDARKFESALIDALRENKFSLGCDDPGKLDNDKSGKGDGSGPLKGGPPYDLYIVFNLKDS